MTRLEQMSAETPAFDPFTGPLSDRKGNEVVAAGETMSIEDLGSMQWAAEGIRGDWPDEP